VSRTAADVRGSSPDAGVVPSARPRDSRTFRRVAAALILVVPATCIAVSRVVSPGLLAEDSAGVLQEVVAAPGRSLAAVWLSVAAAFTLVPAFWIAARLAMRRRPVLATVAGATNAVAYLGMGITFTAMGPLYVVAADAPGSQQDVLAHFLDELSNSGWGTISALTFILGHLLGGVLLGLALRGTLPTWAWLAMTVSMPAHLASLVVLQNLVVDAFCWGLAAAALAACAVHLLRLPDDEWDLPPSDPVT
jgi:hypothetical protein